MSGEDESKTYSESESKVLNLFKDINNMNHPYGRKYMIHLNVIRKDFLGELTNAVISDINNNIKLPNLLLNLKGYKNLMIESFTHNKKSIMIVELIVLLFAYNTQLKALNIKASTTEAAAAAAESTEDLTDTFNNMLEYVKKLFTKLKDEGKKEDISEFKKKYASFFKTHNKYSEELKEKLTHLDNLIELYSNAKTKEDLNTDEARKIIDTAINVSKITGGGSKRYMSLYGGGENDLLDAASDPYKYMALMEKDKDYIEAMRMYKIRSREDLAKAQIEPIISVAIEAVKKDAIYVYQEKTTENYINRIIKHYDDQPTNATSDNSAFISKLEQLFKEPTDGKSGEDYNFNADITKYIDDNTITSVIAKCVKDADSSKMNECFIELKESGLKQLAENITKLNIRTQLLFAHKFDIRRIRPDSYNRDVYEYESFDTWSKRQTQKKLLTPETPAKPEDQGHINNIKIFVEALIDNLNNNSVTVTELDDKLNKKRHDKAMSSTKTGDYSIRYVQPSLFNSYVPDNIPAYPGVPFIIPRPIPLMNGGDPAYKAVQGSEMFRVAYEAIKIQLRNRNKRISDEDNKKIINAIDRLKRAEIGIAEFINTLYKYNMSKESNDRVTENINFSEIEKITKNIKVHTMKMSDITDKVMKALIMISDVLDEKNAEIRNRQIYNANPSITYM